MSQLTNENLLGREDLSLFVIAGLAYSTRIIRFLDTIKFLRMCVVNNKQQEIFYKIRSNLEAK